MFSWSYVIEYFPKIIDKFPVTLQLVFIPFVVSFALGFGIALLRLKTSGPSIGCSSCMCPMCGVRR